ncbi:MAG: hypothetical protein GX937_04975 [Lentisphaerae bacterium]|jgi:hypothetical protein|nr:hypothetical protein [Lentisphaerota bacterium]
MKRFIAKIKQEWERSLLVAVGLLLLGFLGWVGFSLLSEEGGTTSQTQALPSVPDYIDTKSFAFMQPANLQAKVNPMAFRKKLPKAFVTPPPKPTPSGTTAVKPPDTKPTTGTVKPPADTGKKPDGKQPTTVAVKPSGDKPPPKPQPPKPPPRKITVLYRGMYKGMTDRELAFIKADDSKSKKSKVFYVGEGGKVHNVLTVKSFNRDTVVLDCGGDREVTAHIGKKQEIVLE